MNFVPDDWLASLMHIPVYRVEVTTAEALDTVQSMPVPADGRVFFYTKIPVENVNQTMALTKAGFNIVDVNVQFERLPSKMPAVISQNMMIRQASPSDEYTVLNIAGSCFRYSRFHLDPLINHSLANTIKQEWIASYINKTRGVRLLVAEIEGVVVGFLAVLIDNSRRETAIVDLIGVDPSWQGRSVGQELINYLIMDSIDKYACIRVGTQIANIPSLRLYEKCGFHVASAAYVLHAHFSTEQIIQ